MSLSSSSDRFGANAPPGYEISAPPGYEIRDRQTINGSVDGSSDDAEFMAENDLRNSARAPMSAGHHLLPPGLVPHVGGVVPTNEEFVVPNMAAASQAPLPGLTLTDGEISSGGWTDEDEKEHTLNESFHCGRSSSVAVRAPPVPAVRVVKENPVEISGHSNGVANAPRVSATASSAHPPGLPVPSPVAARRLSKVTNSPVPQVDEKELDALNASFANIYKDASRNISNSSPTRVDSPVAEAASVFPPLTESLHSNAVAPQKPPALQKISSRFSAPSMPNEPPTSPNNMIAMAREIMSKGPTAARQRANSSNIMHTINNYFPTLESIADISMLPIEIVALVDNCPQLFVVECEEPGQMKVKLRCQPSPEVLAVKGVRQAVEGDFVWMQPAHCIIPLDVPQFVCVAAMYFIPPRGILFASFWGNDRAERFRHVQSLIEPFVPILKPVDRVIPGMPCVVREDGDYARAVVVDKAEGGTVKLICMDNYAFVSAAPSDIFELPDQLDTEHIKCSLFLARIRGVSSVPVNTQDRLTEMIDEMMRGLMCTAGVLSPAKGSDSLCACDIVIQNTEIWLSTEIIEKFCGEEMPNEPPLDASMTNTKVIDQYSSGYYDFDKSMVSLREAPGMEQPAAEEKKDERNVSQQDSSVDFDLGKEMLEDGEIVSDDDSIINHIQEESLLANAIDTVPLVQQQIDIGQTSGLVPHIAHYSAFVDYMLAGAANQTIKMCVIHNAISQAMFLKMNCSTNDEDAKAVEELIARLKQMA